MEQEIEKVNVEEIEKQNIEKDDSFPAALAFYIKLDTTPKHEWTEVFENEWKHGLYSMKRKMTIVGDKLRVVVGGEGEVMGAVDFAKTLIERTNNAIDRYNGQIKQKNAIEAEQQKKIDKEKRKIQETLGKME